MPDLITPRERLFAMHQKMSADAYKLLKQKNNDYSSEDDPLLNFRRHGLFGMLVRMDDKLARLGNFSKKGVFSVVTETVYDTLIDIINYAVLFAFWIEEHKEKANAN